MNGNVTIQPLYICLTAWTEAIEMMGLGNEANVRAKVVQFKVIARRNSPELTDLEMEELCAGLELDCENYFGDLDMALIQGKEILKK
jgi:hypothetical protein